MKEQTIIPAGVMRRAWALLLAAALCLGLMPSAAWAEESEGAGTFSVALTIVDTSDPADGILYNGKVDGMTSDDTVADLLAKAGFTAAASAEETEGNDKAYFDSWGSPTFRGNKSVQQPDGSWAYWATMFDGDSANYASAQLTSKLQENGRYQYIYTSDATFAYDEEIPQLAIYTVNDPLAGAIKPDPKPEPEPDEPANDAIAVDSAAYNTLFGTIASSYAGTSEEWKALESSRPPVVCRRLTWRRSWRMRKRRTVLPKPPICNASSWRSRPSAKQRKQRSSCKRWRRPTFRLPM